MHNTSKISLTFVAKKKKKNTNMQTNQNTHKHVHCTDYNENDTK